MHQGSNPLVAPTRPRARGHAASACAAVAFWAILASNAVLFGSPYLSSAHSAIEHSCVQSSPRQEIGVGLADVPDLETGDRDDPERSRAFLPGVHPDNIDITEPNFVLGFMESSIPIRIHSRVMRGEMAIRAPAVWQSPPSSLSLLLSPFLTCSLRRPSPPLVFHKPLLLKPFSARRTL